MNVSESTHYQSPNDFLQYHTNDSIKKLEEKTKDEKQEEKSFKGEAKELQGDIENFKNEVGKVENELNITNTITNHKVLQEIQIVLGGTEKYLSFVNYALELYTTDDRMTFYAVDIPNDWTEQQAQLYIDTLILSAKLAALTPPQGYPNAPFYYAPEHLEDIYKRNDLDKRLNPTIPAMYRYNFPEDLRKKIESYAKEHNIKE